MVLKAMVITLTFFSFGKTSFSLPKAKSDKVKPVMQGFFADMSLLLPMSLDDRAFFAAENAKVIGQTLERMKLHGDKLNDITKNSQDEVLRLNGKEFSYFSQEAATAFFRGNKPKAQALIQFQTESCMSCHTMQKTSSEPTLPLNFLSAIEYANLSVWAKARYLTMARQFHLAMDEYEQLLSSDAIPQGAKILSTAYHEYLIVGLRVLSEEKRVKGFLTQQVKKGEPEIVAKAMKSWIASIDHVHNLKKPWTEATARALITKAEAKKSYPADKNGVVYYIYASDILRSALDASAKLPKAELAAVHYSLGQCELGIDVFNFKAMNYFEKAIRLAPGSKTALKAYELYKENLHLSFSGSGGTHIPEEDSKRLEELGKLIKL